MTAGVSPQGGLSTVRNAARHMMAWAGRRLWSAGRAVIRGVAMAHEGQVRMWEMQYGRFFNHEDVKKGTAVCVLGKTVVDKLFEYRQVAKLKSTYVDTLPTLINPDTGRVHTTYNQTRAATGLPTTRRCAKKIYWRNSSFPNAFPSCLLNRSILSRAFLR